MSCTRYAAWDTCSPRESMHIPARGLSPGRPRRCVGRRGSRCRHSVRSWPCLPKRCWLGGPLRLVRAYQGYWWLSGRCVCPSRCRLSARAVCRRSRASWIRAYEHPQRNVEQAGDFVMAETLVIDEVDRPPVGSETPLAAQLRIMMARTCKIQAQVVVAIFSFSGADSTSLSVGFQRIRASITSPESATMARNGHQRLRWHEVKPLLTVSVRRSSDAAVSRAEIAVWGFDAWNVAAWGTPRSLLGTQGRN